MADRLFPLGGPVPEEEIVDREDFIVSLQARLSGGQSVMLTGPRRIGKTSLAHEVLRRLKRAGLYTAAVDFFRFSSKRDFAISLINTCLENRTGIRKTLDVFKERARIIASGARLAVKVDDLEIGFGFPSGETDEDTLLNYALDLPGILAEHDNKFMVVLLDEFQDAPRVANAEIYKKMRAHFQTQEKVAYLFLGSKEGMMETLFGGRKQAFFRFATIIPIPPIPEEAWASYIAQKFQGKGVETDEQSMREIVRITGGHPQDTMLVCSEIYYALLEAGENRLSLGIVRLGLERAMLTLAPIFDEVLDELGRRLQVRKVLQRIAVGKNVYAEKSNPGEIKRAIDHLLVKGIIEKTGRGTYAFVEPLFQQYLQREFF